MRTDTRAWYRWAVNYRDHDGKIKQVIVEATAHDEAITAGQHSQPGCSDFTAIKQSLQPI